jgi:hypothetical protein
MFCQSCGKQIADTSTFCPNCGAPVRATAPWNYPSAPRPVEPVSGAWYLVPFFFGFIGGIIAWAVTKDRDPNRARNLLIFGIVWSIVWVVVIIAIGLIVFVATAPIPPSQ